MGNGIRRNIGSCILHEDVAFWTYDEDGVWFGCIGEAFFYEDSTIIIHRGGMTTANIIKRTEPKYVRLHGSAYNVEKFVVGIDGHPRFFIGAGYHDFFSEHGLEVRI